MNRKILLTGVILVAVAATTAAFTVWALQPSAPVTEQAQTPSSQSKQADQAIKGPITPFKEILADQLGIKLDDLEMAFQAAREKFLAQSPEQHSRGGRGMGRFMAHGKAGLGMEEDDSYMMMGGPGGGHWMKKTTIMHEFYQMGPRQR